jgi:hypothetical protein
MGTRLNCALGGLSRFLWHDATKMGLSPLARAIALALAIAAAVGLVGPTSAGADKKAAREPASAAAPSEEDANDPAGANAACYVCHMTFVKEELAKRHLKAKVGCIQCHGLSAKHANDENVGATKPDITFKRDQVDAACGKCHPRHNVPAKQVIARFTERRLPANSAPICTDCHGQHKIARAAEKN